jgi:hypothetical protein
MQARKIQGPFYDFLTSMYRCRCVCGINQDETRRSAPESSERGLVSEVGALREGPPQRVARRFLIHCSFSTFAVRCE